MANKRDSFKQAKQVYPDTEVSRVEGFALTQDNGLILSGHEQPVSMVVYRKGDIQKLKMMCEIALLRMKNAR